MFSYYHGLVGFTTRRNALSWILKSIKVTSMLEGLDIVALVTRWGYTVDDSYQCFRVGPSVE